MDMAGQSACTECRAASQKTSELIDEHNVLEAQRDHYSARCDELTKELGLARQQLDEKFKISECSPNHSWLFDSESVERLREWQKCLAFCIEERLEKEERTTQSSELEDRQREGEGGGVGSREPRRLSRRGDGLETVLPFSPGNLTGFLTKNHQLTQKYTEYPESKQRKPQTGKSHFKSIDESLRYRDSSIDGRQAVKKAFAANVYSWEIAVCETSHYHSVFERVSRARKLH